MTIPEQPQRDLLAEVLQDHEEIKGLFAQVEAATGEARQEAFNMLMRKMAVHEAAEEIVVHPLARVGDNGDAVVDQRLDEETRASEALVKMESMDVASAEFAQHLEQLKQAVLAHADSEEKLEHPLIRQDTKSERLQQLAEVYRLAEKTAPTRPHPHGPRSATGNMLVGPIASVIDRVRDALRDAMSKA